MITIVLLILPNNIKNEVDGGMSLSYMMGGDAYMLLEQVYLFYIYILIFELVMVTVVATFLFVALVVTIRKLDKQKIHLCLAVRDV